MTTQLEQVEPVEGTDCWRLVTQHAHDGILLTTRGGRVLAANPAACALLGRTEREMCAEGRTEIVVHDDALERFLAERDRDGAATGIVSLRRKDGSIFLADAASTMFSSAGGEAWSSLRIRDVTEAERARRALELLAHAGRALSSSLDLDETLKNLTDLVVPKLADVCTVDLVEPDGIRRAAVAHRDPSRVGDFEGVRRRAMQPSSTNGVDYVVRTGEPSYVFELTDAWLESATLDRAHFEQARALGVRSFVSVPLVVGARIIGALTLMSDGGVPKFGEPDRSLAQAVGALAATAIDNAYRHSEAIEARRLRDEVLGVVAHDLRGPLNVIQLTTSLLARKSPGTEVETIKRAVRRAEILIQDLLLAAQADSCTIPLELREESLQTILDEIEVLHRPLASEMSLQLVVALEGEARPVQCDRHRVVQMLSNLVSNAIKFTPEKGSVMLRCRAEQERLVFTVTDTGSGIPQHELPWVFDRFWQGAQARHVGAGLGLAISRGIANAHGGEIKVDSVVERGTTFTVVLPIVPPL
ncbi:MAG: ATP-binding protein [Polyangiales bacterium]